MKKLYLCLFLLIFGLLAQAQNQDKKISVADFYYAENDLTARTHGTSVEDQNGNLCALIKVRTTEKGLWSFDVGMLGVRKTELQIAAHPAEIWVYVPFGVTRITIQHEKLGLIDKWRFPCDIEKGCTYIMVLEATPVPPPSGPQQQYLTFQITPANAVLEVNGQLWDVGPDGSSTKFVDFGTYKYRVQAPNYHSDVGIVTVNDPENTQKVTVTLKPDFVEVTLKVEADAEIWINNEKKGVGTWTGTLGKGTYKIECKQANHETSVLSQEITDAQNGQTITLPAPRPIYGSLNIESTPNYATVFIDGKAVGETPKFVKEILVGKHEIRLTKEGNNDHTETIIIAKGERKQVNALLTKKRIQTAPQGALTGKFSVSPSKQVYFSQGNLQYQASSNTWRFAENQWDCVGGIKKCNGTKYGNVFENGVKCNNNDISPSYSGWIDLFGWGTSGYHDSNDPYNVNYQPWSTNQDFGSGYGPSKNMVLDNHANNLDNYDWGVYNKISNGGNQVGVWRTLTNDEWVYLFDKRITSSGIRYVRAIVNGVNGIILLPDDWSISNYPLNNTNKPDTNFDSNTITTSVWNSEFSSTGAVFLPAAGRRYQESYDAYGHVGIYWSSSYCSNQNAYCGVAFGDNNPYPKNNWLSHSSYYKDSGYSVRLVCPIE